MTSLKLQVKINNNDELRQAHDLLLCIGYSTYGEESLSVWASQAKPIWLKTNCFRENKDKIDWSSSGIEDGFKEITLPELRAMVNPMKEYINKTTGEYRKTSEVVSGEQWVELHKKANMAISEGSIIHQWASNDFFIKDGKIIDCVAENYGSFSDWENIEVLWKWQRPTQPEALPFMDDEPKYTDDEVKYMDENGQGRLQSINDQYAEIEHVRQHSHYFKDVSNLDEIDVYMVLKLFNVTDPCLQHIAKKALCAGQRGHKNFNRDLKDILDTAKRAAEINNG